MWKKRKSNSISTNITISPINFKSEMIYSLAWKWKMGEFWSEQGKSITPKFAEVIILACTCSWEKRNHRQVLNQWFYFTGLYVTLHFSLFLSCLTKNCDRLYVPLSLAHTSWLFSVRHYGSDLFLSVPNWMHFTNNREIILQLIKSPSICKSNTHHISVSTSVFGVHHRHQPFKLQIRINTRVLVMGLLIWSANCVVFTPNTTQSGRIDNNK